MSEYVDTSKISIRKINNNIAKDFIVKYHYSHAWTMCSLALGIFYSSDEEMAFFEGKQEDLIGCMVFGNPVGRSTAASLSSELEINNVYELTRLFVHDGYGKNIESYCIGQALGYIKRNIPKIKAVISYSDPEQGHVGTIYKATNAIYQGNDIALMPNYSVSLTKDPYEWLHSRTVSARYGTHNVERLKKILGKTFYRKKESSKHRYLWILTPKREKKKILASLKHPPLPYPTSAVDDTEIEKVTVVEEATTFY
jgi:hypothetical protein